MRFVILAVVAGGCGGGLAIANGTALGASTAMLACDWGQTHSAAAQNWETQTEQNPIMGPEPSTAVVGAYFAGAIALNALAWYLVPKRYRMVLPIVITIAQASSVANNLDAKRHDLGMCGLR